MSNITPIKIQRMIYIIRDQKVMIDSDLAELYGVETKRLNEQVRRNIERFPKDFLFQLTADEYEVLKSQIATSNKENSENLSQHTEIKEKPDHSLRSQIVTSKTGRGGKQKLPYVFTENGVAMLSSVLRSPQAIEVNIAIMRIFTKLRSYLLLEKDLTSRLDKLEFGTNQMFKIVFERLDEVDEKTEPKLSKNRRKIGLKNNN